MSHILISPDYLLTIFVTKDTIEDQKRCKSKSKEI